MISDWQIAYMFLFLAASILGAMYRYPYFAIHLVDIMRRNRTMQYVIQSVTKNMEQVPCCHWPQCLDISQPRAHQMGVSILLGMIVIYWYDQVVVNPLPC